MTDEQEQSAWTQHIVGGKHGKPYVSPYGKIEGLAQRLADFRLRLIRPGGNLPFYGGMVADLEVVLRLLNAREFAEWLRVHGDDEQARFAVEILAALDEQGEMDDLISDIERVVPVAEGQEYAEAVEGVAGKAVRYDAVRAVLVNCGALAADDTETNVPDLIRALLA